MYKSNKSATWTWGDVKQLFCHDQNYNLQVHYLSEWFSLVATFKSFDSLLAILSKMCKNHRSIDYYFQEIRCDLLAGSYFLILLSFGFHDSAVQNWLFLLLYFDIISFFFVVTLFLEGKKMTNIRSVMISVLFPFGFLPSSLEPGTSFGKDIISDKISH